jgi:type I restriction enzyme S subunit
MQLKIGAYLGAYDELIENNQRRIAILEAMAWVVFGALFSEDAHRDADLTAFGMIASDVRDGVTPVQLAEDTPYVGLEHIPRKSIVLSEYGDIADVTSRKWKFQRNDILFGKLRPYFHKVVRANQEGVSSTDTIVIRPRTGYETYALFIAASEAFVAHATGTAGGTDRPRANWSDLAAYPVMKPPEETMKRFNAAVGPMVELMFNLVEQNRNLAATRRLLLPKLISGEIDISELDIDTSWLAA